MLRLLLGRSGAGKTQQCFQEIVTSVENKTAVNCFYLVPEQGSFFAEKSLLKQLKKGGALSVQVLSFQRLAWWVLQETGGALHPSLDELGKTLILKHILTKNKDEFKVFARVLEEAGFISQFSQALAEMKNYCQTPESLAACLTRRKKGLTEELAAKLVEFTFVYQEFEKYIENEFLDPTAHLQLLVKQLPQAEFLKKTEVWIDGFHGFTPLEFAVIKELLTCSQQVNLTLCLDPQYLDQDLPETHLFFKPWETYQALLELATEARVPVADIFVLPAPRERRFRQQTALAFLEESFAEPQTGFAKKTVAFKIEAAANRQEEVEKTVQEILFLCQEKNLRYQDIAVLLRDFSHYEVLITNIFQEHGLPFFLDKKKTIEQHPLVDLILSFLELGQSGWSYEALFRCSKTDLFPLARREIDLLENYCLANGLQGRQWLKKQGDEQVNRVREKLVAWLLPAQEAWATAVVGRDYCELLFSFLEKMEVAQKLARWSRQAEAQGNLEEARLHEQVWQKILELLDRLVEVLGEEPMSLAEFSQIMAEGLATLELGLIPPGLDQILVGSVDRSRHPDLKAVLILGFNEGVFPAKQTESSLFNDAERLFLAEEEIVLAPTTEKKLYTEQFLLYRALTIASHYVWLSFALADETGKALAPSSFVSRVQALFPQAEIVLEPQEEIREVRGTSLAWSHLWLNLRQAREGKEIAPFWWDIYNWFLKQVAGHSRLTKMKEGLFFRREKSKLPLALGRQLYGECLQISVSRLEKFSACPFAHFLAYGLQLRERVERQLAAPELGQFFHLGLERFYQYLAVNNLVHQELSMGERETIVQQIVAEIAPALENEILFSTARYRYLTNKLTRILKRALTVLAEHERRGCFQPSGLEVSFGKKGSLAGLNFVLPAGTHLELNGRIDRLETAEIGEETYLRIVDYKSGKVSLTLEEIYYGLKLQLLTYLSIALKQEANSGKTVKPGGILYFPIRDPLIISSAPLTTVEVEKEILKRLKMQGYLLRDPQIVQLMDREIKGYSDLLPVALSQNGQFYKNIKNVWTAEEFHKLTQYVQKLLCQFSQEIMAGEIAIRPFLYRGEKPCLYCPYLAVCGFDLALPGYEYRFLPASEPETIWAKIDEGKINE